MNDFKFERLSSPMDRVLFDTAMNSRLSASQLLKLYQETKSPVLILAYEMKAVEEQLSQEEAA